MGLSFVFQEIRTKYFCYSKRDHSLKDFSQKGNYKTQKEKENNFILREKKKNNNTKIHPKIDREFI